MNLELPPLDEGWNLFAVELSAVLKQHAATLRALERYANATSTNTIVNRAVVNRLVASLKQERTFPILNVHDLDLVCDLFDFSLAERRHLIAAIFATSIQQKLTERTDNTRRAREAAYAILGILERALEEAETNKGFWAGMRNDFKGEGNAATAGHAFFLALEAIDRGNMAIHVLDYAKRHSAERSQIAHEAQVEFQNALALLTQVAGMDQQGHYDWSYWQTEAQEGLLRASEEGE